MTETQNTDKRASAPIMDTHEADNHEGKGKINRRTFLGGAAAVAGTAAMAYTFRQGFEDPYLEPTQHGRGDLVDTYNETDIVHSMCMMCNTWCSIKVRLADGGNTGATAQVRKIAGNPYSALTTQPVGPIPYDTSPADAVKPLNVMSRDSRSRSGGIACLKGQAGIQIAHDAKRIKQPLKRVGARGEGKWKTISWEEALDGILNGDDELGTPGLTQWYQYVPEEPVMADKDAVDNGEMTQQEFEDKWGEALIDPKRPELGPKSNLLSVMGGDRQQIIGNRWANNMFGTINQVNHGGTCGVTGVFANARSHPDNGFQRMYGDIDYADYLVVWGSEPLVAQKGPTFLAPRVGLARERGMKMTVIDPKLSKTAEKADLWVPVKPGEDAWLAWGIIRWIIENERYDEQYLRAPSKDAATEIGEPTYSDATHLVVVDEGEGWKTKPKLNVVHMGIGEAPEEQGQLPEPMCMVNGELTPVDSVTELADLEVDTTVDTPDGPVKVKSAFTLLKERAMEHELDTYADRSGTTADVISEIGHDFTAHGKRAVVMSYRGPAMHANGYDAIRAINYINFLIGNHDWKGGHITGQKQYTPWAGRYDIQQGVPNARKAWGMPITRERTKYENTSFFEEDGYPAKRRFYQFPGNLCHEVIPSAEAGFPYSLNALFIHRHSPINSAPNGRAAAETLKKQDKIKLLVVFDITMGDTGVFADYLLPDLTYLERFSQEATYPAQQYAVTQLGQPTTRIFEGPRPVEVTYMEIAKAMNLPGIGENAFGDGAHWNTYEDLWMKVAANVAFSGGDAVPDANEDEMRIFEDTRNKVLKDHFDVETWKAGVTDEEWPKVVYVLNRGGRFEGHGEDRANGYDADNPEWLKYRYEGLCQFYEPRVSAAKDPITGEFFDGMARLREITRADGSPIPGPDEGYPLKMISWKARTQGTHRTVNAAWLRELRPSNYLHINTVDAKERGIENGDKVRLKSPAGEIDAVAMVTEGIRPGVVGADATMGHTQYGSKPYEVDGEIVSPPKKYGHGDAVQQVVPGKEELGYAGPRDSGFGVNELLVGEDLVGGGGMSDPLGGGAAQLDTWIELEKV